MPTYVVPPPPRPVETHGEDKEENEYISPCLPTRHLVGSLSPKSSPRPPHRYRNPFETVELNLPASQVQVIDFLCCELKTVLIKIAT